LEGREAVFNFKILKVKLTKFLETPQITSLHGMVAMGCIFFLLNFVA